MSLIVKLIRLKKKIETEYNELLDRIKEYEKELNEWQTKYDNMVREVIDNPREKLPTRINNCREGVLTKIGKLKNSIKELQKYAEEKYQNALKDAEDYVNDQIKKQTEAILKEEEEKELAKSLAPKK